MRKKCGNTINTIVPTEAMEAFHKSIHDMHPFRKVTADSKCPSIKISDAFVSQSKNLEAVLALRGKRALLC